jgi:hypothetical protein
MKGSMMGSGKTSRRRRTLLSGHQRRRRGATTFGRSSLRWSIWALASAPLRGSSRTRQTRCVVYRVRSHCSKPWCNEAATCATMQFKLFVGSSPRLATPHPRHHCRRVRQTKRTGIGGSCSPADCSAPTRAYLRSNLPRLPRKCAKSSNRRLPWMTCARSAQQSFGGPA